MGIELRESNRLITFQSASGHMQVLVPQNAAAQQTSASCTRTGTWLEIEVDHAGLMRHLTDWQDLVRDVTEPNPYYEPPLLLSAAAHMTEGKELLFVHIYHRRADEPTAELIGLFPLERKRQAGLIVLRGWDHDYTYLCTPLVRRGFGRLCWDALVDWMRSDRHNGSILELPFFPAEGPVYQSLVDLIRERGFLTFEYEKYSRAWFQRRSSAEHYLEQAISSSKRRDLQRKWRRLNELGRVEMRHLHHDSDLDQWVADFLQLESSGWKGAERTAIANDPNGTEFLRSMTRMAFDQGSLMMTGLYLDNRPMAMRCNLLAPPGAFFFKPAYDEEFSRYSPGVHVEVETIRALHLLDGISWMDSCTSAENGLLNSMWLERRLFQTLQIAVSGPIAPLYIGAIRPALRWVNRSLGFYRR